MSNLSSGAKFMSSFNGNSAMGGNYHMIRVARGVGLSSSVELVEQSLRGADWIMDCRVVSYPNRSRFGLSPVEVARLPQDVNSSATKVDSAFAMSQVETLFRSSTT
ncbi:unnamed protein product [Sympodiomycopsis kandeliae]